MKTQRFASHVLVLVLLCMGSGTTALAADREPHQVFIDRGAPANGRSLHAFNALKARAEGQEPVSVIVRFSLPARAAATPAQERQAVSQSRRKVLDHLDLLARGAHVVKREFESLPLVSMYVQPRALDALLHAPGVVQIQENVGDSVTLDGTVNIVEADLVHGQGVSGTGMAIAVLDTGVANHHPFTSKVVHERCFSTNDSFSESLCPNGLDAQAGTGSAEPCNSSISCYHATHVAGIAAGKASGVSFTGVARDASIIDINVFARIRSSGALTSYTDDQIAALDHVFGLRDTFNIAAVNMSLGGPVYSTGYCDSDVRKVAIDRLGNAGIAVVISSGNNGYKDRLGSPACISSAISVGNTHNNDVVNSSSNSASTLDVLAPGTSVNSAFLNSSLSPIYSSQTGTSMAAPHVAGAIALIKQVHPGWSVSQVESYLKSNGPQITDTNGITKRRLDLTLALRPEKPTVYAEYLQCSGYGSLYSITWLVKDRSTITQWDVDIQTYGNSTWNSYYNGSSSSISPVIHNKTRFRARARNAYGWGAFAYTTWLTNSCGSGGGGPLDPY